MKNTRLKMIAVLALLVAHLLSPVLVAYGHQDIVCGSASEGAGLRSHDCGTREIHVPLDECDHCILCLRVSVSIAVFEETLSTLGIVPQSTILAQCIPSAASGDHESQPDRGPPAFAS